MEGECRVGKEGREPPSQGRREGEEGEGAKGEEEEGRGRRWQRGRGALPLRGVGAVSWRPQSRWHCRGAHLRTLSPYSLCALSKPAKCRPVSRVS